MKKTIHSFSFIATILFISCVENNQKNDIVAVIDKKTEKIKPFSIDDIVIEKELLYDKHTLSDTYPYNDTTRHFQWEKIKDRLYFLDSIQMKHGEWGVLQNYRNGNGEAPLVKEYKRNVYKRIADNYGIERYQSVPLFSLTDTLKGERYGQDGSVVKVIGDAGNFIKIETTNFPGEWLVPKKYITFISDTINFDKVIIVDRKYQNISTFEKSDKKWLVRSMNPATTGLHKPPHQKETPLGLFVIQEKKAKMYFLKDGTTLTGGFAPYACRFHNGGYIHGIPVNAPNTKLIEFSRSLGTTPRSHMCVRNATSHAKFIYDWATPFRTVVFIIE